MEIYGEKERVGEDGLMDCFDNNHFLHFNHCLIDYKSIIR